MENTKSKILYVDDETFNLTAFKTEFRKYYQIYTADCAKEGMKILKEHEISVIIADQRMPEVTGVEFLEQSITEYPVTIRMILTGYSDIEAIINAINKGGIYKYITKPWDEKDLKITIDNAIETYHLKRENRNLIEGLQKANQSLEEKVNQRTSELEHKNEKLEELNREKDGIINIVAHDLKSPFNKIKGFMNLMPMVGTLNDEQKSYIKQVKEIIQEGDFLIRDLLDINAFKYNEAKLETEELEINEFIKHWTEGYMQELERKNQIFNCDIKPENIKTITNKELLSRILDNLFTNAIKFSEKGTTISMNIWQENGHIFYKIKDQGPGISPEDQKKLFKKFQRLSAKPTAGESSTGLGLSIIKALIEKLNGEINYKSKIGEGSEFIVTLPSTKII